jgi:alkaline phosphatase
MLKLLSNIHIYLGLLLIISLSCSKNNSLNQVDIQPIETQKKLSLIILLGDGLGVSQMTAAWNEQKFLNLQRYPYSGLVLTQSVNKFVTESGAANTAMMTGVKTNYGYLGLDVFQNPQETLYEYLRKEDYLTGIISTSFMADATLAALFSHRTDRHAYEDIILDYYHEYPDFAVTGGKKHFDNREDQINLLDSLSSKGVQIVYQLNEINSAEKLPVLGLMHESLPPYLVDGREDFLYQSSMKALELFDDHPFFLFIEGGHIDKAGHDMNIEKQISETLEFDKVAGMAMDYAKNKENVLVVVLSDHECGGLSLMPGADNEYIPNYAANDHSGSMVAVFAYGPGAENFTGIMDNTDIYEHLKTLIDLQINN